MANGVQKRIGPAPGLRMYRRYWICLAIVFAILTIQVIVSLFAVNSVTESDKRNQVFPTQHSDNKIHRDKSTESRSAMRKAGKRRIPSHTEKQYGSVYEEEENGVEDFKSKDSHAEYQRPAGGPSRSRSRTVVLNTADMSFVPECDIRDRDAISAINRATTQSCKQELAHLSCLLQSKSLYPKRLPSFCHLTDGNFGDYVGCYADEPANHILLGAKYRFGNKANNPVHCLNTCFQSGFRYAGLVNLTHCHCGDELETSSMSSSSTMRPTPLPDDACNQPCPVKHNKAESEESAIGLTPVRIAFILTVTGRGVRQVKRLLNSIYSQNHFYYIHVDQRQDYLYRKLVKLETDFENVRLSRNRYATIWGGASLLRVLLSSMQDLLTMSGWSSNWDYVINLSESDFPIKSLERLELFLTANRGMNFVKSHGQDTQKFIAKQGLDRAFYECDEHMWRFGRRPLPTGIRLDGGSDWIALTHDFASYLIFANNTLIRGLLQIYAHTLLPAESFFHTALINSEHCDHVIDNNLHVTNWKRKLGCKCQYKHIVDWCGCSPNVFLASDWNRILGTQEHDLYFARKFEPVVDLVVINRLESMILEQPLARGEHDVSYNRYWQSIYDRDDRSPAPDGSLTVYQGLASKAVHHVREKCQNRSISSLSHLIWDEVAVAQVNLLMERNRLRGLLINFLSLPNQLDHQVTGEALVRPRRHFIIRKRTYPINRLVGMQVCSEMDQKEMIFRNWGCILSPLSEPSLMHKWRISAEKNSNFTVTFAWVDPSGVTAAASEVRIDTPADPEREDLMLYHKPAINQPLPAGVWRLLLLYADVIAAESKFLIAPILLPDGRQHAPRMRRSGRKAANPSQSDTKLNLSHIQKAILDSNYLEEARRRSKGSHLQSAEPIGSDAPKIEWMDSLLSHFWSLEDVCYNELMGDLSASEKHGIPRQANDTQVMRKDVCRNGRMKSCLKTDWSSFSPDPKSEISFS